MKQNKEYHIYPVDFEKEIQENKFIPRKIRNNEILKVFHRYWIPYYEGICKIMDITDYDNKKYYHIKFGNNMFAVNQHPLNCEGIYELLHNRDNIDQKNIINDLNSYTGAEIKFWFTVNKINFNKEKYKGFWNFFYSDNILIDNKYYFVIYEDHGKDKSYKIIMDRNK